MSNDQSAVFSELQRRTFLQRSAGAMAAIGLPQLVARADSTQPAETLAKILHDSLTDAQRAKVCYDWDFVDSKRGLLRTRVSNNWMINDAMIRSDFYTSDQQELIRKIFESIINPQWKDKFDKQMEDDCGGFGREQSIGLFGDPKNGPFEMVFTGRHMTLRCDGNSVEGAAFGGPIFYGHDPGSFDESKDHPGNVFWQQAVNANRIYEMLDGRQREMAEVAKTPKEQAVDFKGLDGAISGIPISELSKDQKQQLTLTLNSLIEPFRAADQQEAIQILEAQGGLDSCHLAFFTDHDIGDDRIWDNWRLEGPSFVWHFRGAPHVHVWVNISENSNTKLNA